MNALVLVDIQNDFMPFGSLPVPRGDEVVAFANQLAERAGCVVATQDWHPVGHASFASSHPGRKAGDLIDLGGSTQVLWPDHCVQNTPGASFHSGLEVARIRAVVRKGTDPSIDSYSGFFDNERRKATGMADLLSDGGVTRIVLVGLATDYCVRYTALDGRTLGFDVAVVQDGVRSVDRVLGDGERALAEMREAGCAVISTDEALELF